MKKFCGGCATVEETNETIGSMYREHGYLIDTHTAVAYKVYQDYVKETGDETPALIASTASAYKFAESVAKSIGLPDRDSGFAYIEDIAKETGVRVPKALKDLDKKVAKQLKAAGAEAAKKVAVYVKPEENTAYIVADGEPKGSVALYE